MLFARRYLPSLVLAIAVAVLRAAPATAGDAQSVIDGLELVEGYSVQINWLTGYNTVPLSYCTVSNINIPGEIDPDSDTWEIAYVDVRCPNDIY